MIQQQPFDPLASFSLSRTAFGQLADLQTNDPALHGKMIAQILKHIAGWSKGSEDKKILKHCFRISRECGADVFRLSVKPEIQKWRVFFYELDLRKPPKRRIEEVIQCTDHTQCYDTPTEPHVIRLRASTRHFVDSAQMRGKQ